LLLFRIWCCTSLLDGWIQNSPSYIKITFNTLRKWREFVFLNREKEWKTLILYVMSIMWRNLATCSSNLDRNASYTNTFPFNRWHKLTNAFGPKWMSRHCSMCTKYDINSCRRCSFSSTNFLIMFVVLVDRRNTFNS